MLYYREQPRAIEQEEEEDEEEKERIAESPTVMSFILCSGSNVVPAA